MTMLSSIPFAYLIGATMLSGGWAPPVEKKPEIRIGYTIEVDGISQDIKAIRAQVSNLVNIRAIHTEVDSENDDSIMVLWGKGFMTFAVTVEKDAAGGYRIYLNNRYPFGTKTPYLSFKVRDSRDLAVLASILALDNYATKQTRGSEAAEVACAARYIVMVKNRFARPRAFNDALVNSACSKERSVAYVARMSDG
ncbi:hypothetical protein P1X14_11885 [Sphingomonas sp. AOB5]|uniref:hypothetical protein n=1 Tax=Sphingomonas sp. AOB5 TaxID=3034017 RepID=UPI0023F82EB4|nr:hypothetical protein [Sphingomonas sp. AOB5]MDF7775948.1 hypothetical protein [Sphingomonas sp. AOB5]